MLEDKLTRVDKFDGWWAKREDLACFEREDWPSGAKVRQYLKMIEAQPNLPLLVGCSAFSAMQIYIAAAAEKFGVPGIVYVPGREKISDATRYALERGVEVNEVRPCPGPNVYKARAHERGRKLGAYVHWDFIGAVMDAMHQAQNIPRDVRRVLIPTGSGLISAGVLAGLAGRTDLEVVSISGSTMAHEQEIRLMAIRCASPFVRLPHYSLIRSPLKYEQYKIARLPDGTPLDPFYAAKMIPFLQEGDCLWLTGLRPVCSMPEKLQKEFADWHPKALTSFQAIPYGG